MDYKIQILSDDEWQDMGLVDVGPEPEQEFEARPGQGRVAIFRNREAAEAWIRVALASAAGYLETRIVETPKLGGTGWARIDDWQDEQIGN